MFQCLDSVAVLRPTLLFPVWTLVLLGYHHGSTMPEAPTASQPLRLWTTLCLYALLIGPVYIVNQITDRETDAVNNKLYLVARGYVKLTVFIVKPENKRALWKTQNTSPPLARGFLLGCFR